VVEHVDVAEVRIVVAAVFAVAADAVLVAYRFPILCAHLVTTRPVEEIAWRQEARGRKGEEMLSQQVINHSAAVQ
jgi:hypothetical protein